MIELTKNWRIDNSRPPEMILQQRKKVELMKDRKPTGEIDYKWINEGFYTSLESVFRSFLNQYASQGNSITEVLCRIEEVHIMFKDSLTIHELQKKERKIFKTMQDNSLTINTDKVKVSNKTVPGLPVIEIDTKIIEDRVYTATSLATKEEKVIIKKG